MKVRACVNELVFILFAVCFTVTNALSNVVKPDSATGILMVAPAVEGWFFRAVSGYPIAVTFEPVVLFKNGTYWEAGGETLETLNIAADKAKHPKAWGTWKKQGQTFLLTNSKGKTNDYKLGTGNWFPAFAYTNALKLKPTYEKVSGGDYGNGLNAMTISKITFLDGTHFNEGVNGGVSTANAAAWKKSQTGGTYRLLGHSIEFAYNSGKVVKTSFALGAKGSPAKADNALIFIGGYAYTDVE
jgi:hypothetical protein